MLQDAIIGLAPGVGNNFTGVRFSNGHMRVTSGALFQWATTSSPPPDLLQPGNEQPHRNKVRFRPAGAGYIATFEGP